MAPSESLTQVRLDSADVLAGVALSDAAGWNQTVDDWQLFVAHGQAIGFRAADSRLVATAATLDYGRLGWISMVLVAQDWQHRGLATRLLEDRVAHLRSDEVTPVLDATPAGEPVYRRLGFRSGFGLARWEGEASSVDDAAVDDRIRPAGASDHDAIRALDAAASGLERRALLDSFLARQGSLAWVRLDEAGRATGFAIARQGRRATQIGPLVAQSPDEALRLLDTALAGCTGRIFLDVPSRWVALAAHLGARGFRVQRPFVRMALAESLPPDVESAGDRSFVVAGPEFG